MPQSTLIDCTFDQLPAGDLASLPIGTYKIHQNSIDYQYRDANGNKFTNRYHKPTVTQQGGVKPQSKGARKRERKRLAKLDQYALQEQHGGPRLSENRRDRKNEYRKRNQPADQGVFENYILDNHQIQARAALKFENTPESLSSASMHSGSAAPSPFGTQTGLVSQQNEPPSFGSAHFQSSIMQTMAASLYGQQTQGPPSFGNFHFQAPNLQGSPFARKDIGSRGSLSSSLWNPLPRSKLMAPPTKTDSLGVLRSLPAFKQFLPPTSLGQAESPGYLPPGVSFFGHVVPPKPPVFEPSKFSFTSPLLDSPADTSNSSLYEGSSWSSPIHGTASPRPLWTFDRTSTPAPLTTLGVPLTLSDDESHHKSLERIDAPWLKRLPNENLLLPRKNAHVNIPSQSVEYDENNSASIPKLPATSIFYRPPTTSFSSPAKKTVAKQEEGTGSFTSRKENVPIMKREDSSASIWADGKIPVWDPAKRGFSSPLKPSTKKASINFGSSGPTFVKDELEEGEIIETPSEKQVVTHYG